ncbi:hypothetical protein AAC387_Pa08g2315 [Persea americana]
MAIRALHVSEIFNFDHIQENASLALSSSTTQFSTGDGGVRVPYKPARFSVIGHRGSGMNKLGSADRRMRAIKENSILSFDAAARFAVDFVEFDVQVTRDSCPIIFHDNFILAEEEGSISEKRVTELTLQEFLCYGPQREVGNGGKSMFRKATDGRLFSWKVEDDDALCTLKEAFQKVDSSLGFNIELKFDDNVVYEEDDLVHVLQIILQVVFEHAKERPIIFSSFQPDAARLVRKLQCVYPVFFLTDGGSELYTDARRNSLDEAIKLSVACGLQGIVSEVRAIFRNPGAISKLKEANLCLLTYGQLNNVPEAVYMQHLMGINGVIVDLVKEITEAVSDFTKPDEGGEGLLHVREGEGQIAAVTRPNFSQRELSFLLKLIPQLIQP